MLRFTNTLEIALRKQESRFSPYFWKGLGYAIAFHLALFVSFRIASLRNLDILNPLVPVNVEIDLGAREAVAELPSGQSSPLETPAAPSLDALVSTTFFRMEPSPFYTKTKEMVQPDFSKIERLPYSPLEHLMDYD